MKVFTFSFFCFFPKTKTDIRKGFWKPQWYSICVIPIFRFSLLFVLSPPHIIPPRHYTSLPVMCCKSYYWISSSYSIVFASDLPLSHKEQTAGEKHPRGMAELAQKAVFASSTDGKVFCDGNKSVEGPSQEDMQSISGVLRHYATLGFQASHFAQAIEICSKMLQPQPPSMGFQPQSCEDASAPTVLVQPTIFLGATANLFGTGCRDAICFLCKECVPLQDGVEPAVPPEETMTSSPSHDNKDFIPSPSFSSKALIHALVVSGGAMEHDIRRACEEYRIADYESAGGVVSTLNGRQTTEANRLDCQFGNVRYGRNNCSASSSSLFSGVMRRLVARATKLQQQRKAVCAAQAIPAVYDDVCSWALSPSALWYMVGRWLPDIFAEALLDAGEGEPSAVAEKSMQLSKSTVLYWAAINDVPIFSPSFADGDILHFILEAQSSSPLLQIDLVSDIHQINKLAMRSRRTGMLILGGGVVKHHVCNANLMRNGADSAVFINNGQEFDGSDAGARPDEAVSWGKIRMNADSVKVYAEISLIFPLLVTQVFVPWVRASRRFYEPSEAGVTVAADGLKKEVTVVGHMCVKD